VDTAGHKWHVHASDAIDQDDCTTAGGHYDPTHKETDTDGNKIDGYFCTIPTGPAAERDRLRASCYKGDLSGRHGPVSIDGKSWVFTDPTLTVAELAGRSIVIHAADAGAPRVACAKIEDGLPPAEAPYAGKVGATLALDRAQSCTVNR
jgi:hypothetical protein